MKQVLAILCTISWASFWVFGYLALTVEPGESALGEIAAAIAGLVVGIATYLQLIKLGGPAPWRHVEQESTQTEEV